MKKKLNNLKRRIALVKNWYVFMWPCFYFVKWPHVIKFRSGARITIKAFRSMEYAIFNEVITDDEYGIDTMPEVKTVLDIGANIGMFCITVAKKFPNTKIIAVEPSGETYRRLVQNISESGAKNIIAINKAVASSAGKADLYLGHNPGTYSLYGSQEKSEEVETITLDSLLPADIIKMDVEGAEHDIFQKNIPTCKQILLEIHPMIGGNIKSLINRLETKYKVGRVRSTNVYRCIKK